MTTQVEAPTTFRWDRLTYSSALGYCLLVAGLSVGVVLSELRDEFGISGVVAALHGSTFGIGGRRPGEQQHLHPLARHQGLGQRIGAHALAGAGGALLVMVMPGLISDHHGEHRAAAFAAVNGAPGIAGVAFSLVIGGALSAGWSWRPPYLILTGVFTLALVVVAHPVALPDGERHGAFSLRHFFDRDVLVPWAHIVNAVLAEFTVGIWAVTYLREVGHAGAGLAPILASVFGVMMFATRLVGLVIVGFGGAPLYPLTVNRFYQRSGHALDAVALGAYCALASGVAVTLGPLALGALADSVGLRWAILIVPVLAAVGAFTQRSRTVY